MNDIYKQKSLRVTVKYVDGKWEYFYGGLLPIKEGAIADLILDESAITDKGFIKKINRKSRHKILDQGVEILVALTIKPELVLDEKLKEYLLNKHYPDIQLVTPFHAVHLSPDTQFVKIIIGKPIENKMDIDPDAGGGIWLDVQGLQPKGLTTSSVNLPDGVSDEPAISLNHAFTSLSIAYEPWRKSHTGNIYKRMFYKEKNNKWYPLEILRNAAIVKDESLLIRKQWTDIAEKLHLNIN